MEEIIIYLKAPNPDFDEGLALFHKYSRNRSVFLYLQRKHDFSKLRYELEKLSKLEGLKVKTIPHEKVQVSKKIASDAKKIATDANVDSPDAKVDSSDANVVDVLVNEPEGHKIIEPSRVKREDLPDDLKKIFDHIAQFYKLQRTVHEKMKLAKDDKSRAEFRAKVVEFDDLIATGWAFIDESLAAAKADPDSLPAADAPEAAVDVNKAINAARTSISRLIKGYAPEKKAKLLEHINTLIKYNASVKLPTRQKLIELNVIDEKSDLLGK